MQIILIAVIGALGGLSSGLFGVGGGALFVPLLIMLCHVNAHVAIGTSLAVVVPTAVIALTKHSMAGMVQWKTALAMVAFAMIGAWLGAKLSLQLEVATLKRVYAAFLLVLSVKLFFSN